jgi:hypothetical protein
MVPMDATHLMIAAEKTIELHAPPNNVGLGLGIIGLILVLVMALAYVWGKAAAAKRVGQCPTCGAARRGTFCSKCGTKFD